MRGWFHRRAEFLILLLVALGAGPAGAAIWQWSTTAASNASADPTINWAEGMSPSSVNDSARAMMAAVAGWRDDTSGKLVASGSSTAYAVTTNEGLNATPNEGQKLTFVPNVTNGAAPTLTADGGNSYPLQSSYGVAVAAGSLISGTPYSVTFRGGNAWVLHSFYQSPFGVPLGGLLASTVATPPNSNFILPAGQCISTTTYADYWVAVGSPASGGCPGGSFQVIDLRGRMLAALDNLNGIGAGRMTAAAQGCGTAFNSIGTTCANGIEARILSSLQIPTISSVANGVVFGATVLSDRFVASNGNDSTPISVVGGGVGLAVPAGSGGTVTHIQSTGSATGNVSSTSTNTGSLPVSSIPPVIGVSYFLRVL